MDKELLKEKDLEKISGGFEFDPSKLKSIPFPSGKECPDYEGECSRAITGDVVIKKKYKYCYECFHWDLDSCSKGQF